MSSTTVPTGAGNATGVVDMRTRRGPCLFRYMQPPPGGETLRVYTVMLTDEEDGVAGET
jgi:hypothetical protein